MKKTVALIGSGPAALMLAAKLDPQKFQVCIYERNQAPARKFLVAGQGGFNLTHSESPDLFISRYTPAPFFEPLLRSFSNTDLVDWLKSMGIPTYTGTSKRIFPEKGIKPIGVLNAILEELKKKEVNFRFNHEWLGWNEQNEPLFRHDNEIIAVQSDLVVFALGGGSWKITGSDGSWTQHFLDKGIPVLPFQPSNCAAGIAWPSGFLDKNKGKALKNISLRCGEKEKAGEAVLTAFGLEGGVVYALSDPMRRQLREKKQALLDLDLKPQLEPEELRGRIENNRGTHSWTKHLSDRIGLDPVKMDLLKALLTKEEFMSPVKIAEKIKKLPLAVYALAPLDEAISTTGGLPLDQLDEGFRLIRFPNQYAIGEMLDWDAPTGGYLLQGCFSMGSFLASRLNNSGTL